MSSRAALFFGGFYFLLVACRLPLFTTFSTFSPLFLTFPTLTQLPFVWPFCCICWSTPHDIAQLVGWLLLSHHFPSHTLLYFFFLRFFELGANLFSTLFSSLLFRLTSAALISLCLLWVHMWVWVWVCVCVCVLSGTWQSYDTPAGAARMPALMLMMMMMMMKEEQEAALKFAKRMREWAAGYSCCRQLILTIGVGFHIKCTAVV